VNPRPLLPDTTTDDLRCLAEIDRSVADLDNAFEPDPRKSTAIYAGSTASENASRSADSLLTLKSASSRGHTNEANLGAPG